eukprot:Partr_v1_DN26133_c1_g1_i7_m10789 putative NADH dehydrogenase (ubiquinone) complex I, assembly factor 5
MISRRLLATQATPSLMRVFDRSVKWQQRENAARIPDDCRLADYLRDEVGGRIVDRMADIKRRLPRVLDLGAGAGQMTRKHLDRDLVDEVVMMDMSSSMLHRDASTTSSVNEGVKVSRVVGDEERLPFTDNSFDAVLSSLSLHWVNDLPGALVQVNEVLKPDAPFIAAMFGGDTLFELRCSLQLAESERRGGISPHISPFTQPADVSSLLSRADFNLTTSTSISDHASCSSYNAIIS